MNSVPYLSLVFTSTGIAVEWYTYDYKPRPTGDMSAARFLKLSKNYIFIHYLLKLNLGYPSVGYY